MERMEKPKFIKEIEKFEGKERAECGRWYIRVYGELDHKPMVELESLINRYSIDTVCNKPDYELAEIIWQLLF